MHCHTQNNGSLRLWPSVMQSGIWSSWKKLREELFAFSQVLPFLLIVRLWRTLNVCTINHPPMWIIFSCTTRSHYVKFGICIIFALYTNMPIIIVSTLKPHLKLKVFKYHSFSSLSIMVQYSHYSHVLIWAYKKLSISGSGKGLWGLDGVGSG